MNSYLIDTHCHLHDQEWFTPEQSAAFLQGAAANDVRQIIVIGTNPEDSQNAHDFANSHDNVFWTYGIHPEFAKPNSDAFNNESLYSLLSGTYAATEERILQKKSEAAFTKEKTKRVRDSSISVTTELENVVFRKDDCKSRIKSLHLVAIGEIGLDYHYEGYNRPAQIQLFEQMLQLARDLDLAVSLHIRERAAFVDAWAVLDNFPEIKGVVHSFTGSKADLKRALDRDFYIGVNGLATYATIPLPPLEKILLETDAPFLTPVPFRGTMNKPEYVRIIATYLAEKLGVAEVKIAEQTTKNARQLFQLDYASVRPAKSL